MTPKDKRQSVRAGNGRKTTAAEAVPHSASLTGSCTRLSGCDSAIPRGRSRGPKLRGPTEHQEAVALMQWARLAKVRHPELSLMYAIPNGGDRHPAVAAKLKAEGVRAGIPDYCLPVARGGFHALYVELKTLTGRASREQVESMRNLEAAGNCCYVARGWLAASEAIDAYLRLDR